MCVKDNLGSNITHEIQLKMLRNVMEVVKQSTFCKCHQLLDALMGHTHTHRRIHTEQIFPI